MRDGTGGQAGGVLVVDLDGTLIASDLLFESIWAGLSRRPGATLAALAAVFGPGGRAALKRRLAGTVELDVARIPLNAAVVDHVAAWRAAGGRTMLVTASDQGLADRIAERTGLFDEVHGSDGRRNLKGEAKADFVAERCAGSGFAYVGDAAADLPVWRRATRAVTVNAPPALVRAVERLGPEAVHLRTGQGRAGDWVRALRTHQWLKNLLIFVPMLASHAFTPEVAVQSILAFVAFSLIASSVYLANDLLDLEADRAHPRKRLRPLASGAIPIGRASAAMPGLLAAGLALGALLGPGFVLVLGAYFVLTTAYSVHLKRRTIIDIWVLAVLYAMRILAGSAATGITPSVWLMAFSIFFFFSLAAVKRQAELVDLAGRDEDQIRGRGYHRDDVLLIGAMAISSGYLSVLVMALYVRTPFIDELYGFPQALLGICLVLLYWVSRVVLLTHRGLMTDDPLLFALRDPVSRLCLLAMGGSAVIASVF